MVSAGLFAASRMSSARALPGPRQGSCRGVAVVPGKDFARGLVVSFSENPVEVRLLLFLL